MRTAAVPAVLVAGALLAGCATDERGELRALVGDITLEANERDADGVRRGTEDLLSRLDDAVASGALSEAEAAVLRDRAQALQAGADEIDPRVLAAREAERRAAEAEARLEAERRAAEEAARRAAEQAAREDEDEDKGEGKGEGKDDKADDDEADDGGDERASQGRGRS